MRIQHNVTALNSYRNLRGNNSALSKNLEKLSSGYRINRAGDDAAGLAVSEKMRAQIRGLETAEKNAQDGISLIQTAEGALTEVHSMLNRMVELATQSANGTFDNPVDRKNLQAEVTSLKNEIDRISQASNYNGIKLLDGSLSDGASKANLPNVTVNGVTGQATTGGVDSVIEVKSSDDWKFKGAFKINQRAAGTSGAAEGVNKLADENGDNVKATVKFNDASGKERKIEFSLVAKKGGSNDEQTIDMAKSKVLLDGKELDASKVLADSATAHVTGGGAAGKTTITEVMAKALGKIEDFNDLFKVEAGKSATEVAGATEVETHLLISAKKAGKAEVTSILTNGGGQEGSATNVVQADVQLTNTNAKIKDQITVHGEKMFGVGGAKKADGDPADVTIEEQIKTATIEVNGEKFLFANKALEGNQDFLAAAKAAGVNEKNIVYSAEEFTTLGTPQKMDKKDAKAMVDRINETLGEEVASIDDKVQTDILFKGKDVPGGMGSSNGLTLQIGDTADAFNKMSVSIQSMSTRGLKINNVDVSNQDAAASSIKQIKEAINSVSSTRGDLGALQNRLEHTISNLGVMTENITDAESRIRDTDMAKEMMAYTKNNILLQASQAMLAQANQIPQGVLQLLG